LAALFATLTPLPPVLSISGAAPAGEPESRGVLGN
jgi:hypothetical protein